MSPAATRLLPEPASWNSLTGKAARPGSWLRSTHETGYSASLLGHPPSRQVALVSLAACQKRFTAGCGEPLGRWGLGDPLGARLGPVHVREPIDQGLDGQSVGVLALPVEHRAGCRHRTLANLAALEPAGGHPRRPGPDAAQVV